MPVLFTGVFPTLGAVPRMGLVLESVFVEELLG